MKQFFGSLLGAIVGVVIASLICLFINIFLSKDPETAWEHIQSRHQAGDSGVTLEYLKELDMYYKRMLTNVPCRVLVVNANRDPIAIHKQILEYLSKAGNVRPKAVRPKECTNMCSVS